MPQLQFHLTKPLCIMRKFQKYQRLDYDDDRYTYHDPKKWKPMWTKEEVLSCSSNFENDDADGDEMMMLMMITLVIIQWDLLNLSQTESQRRMLKGLFACEICEQDYTNGSNLVNHMVQHEGITCTHVTNVIRYFSHEKSFDNHARTHSDGLLTCDQCGKTFQYLGSLSNHFKTHTNKVYVCECEDCAKRNKSYSMYLEHIQYGHAETPDHPVHSLSKILPNTDSNVYP